MNTITRALLAGATAAVFTATAGLTGAQAATACPTGWGSQAKGGTAGSSTTFVQDVRAGRHACFDRLVIDVQGKIAARAYDARYVPAVYEDASGFPVRLRGGAFLQLVVRAPSYDSYFGRVTYSPANGRELVSTAGFRTLRQVAFAGSFEGQTNLGIGVRARLPFRVTVLNGPGTGSRVVLDVAHRW